MLAHHPGHSGKIGVFFLVVHEDREVAELVAQCPKCGAATSYALELAWRLRTLVCSECATSMRLTDHHLRRLRERLAGAHARLDHLLDCTASTPPSG